MRLSPLSLLIVLLCISHSVSQSTCPRGTFRAQPSLQCVSCPPGTFQNTLNATSCTQCPPGRFQPFSAAQTPLACRPCPPGTFSTSASAACFSCPPGLSSAPASAMCVTCQPGTFLSAANSSMFQSPCQPCAGGFTDTLNQPSCTPCTPGFVGPFAATSAQQCTIACPPGTQSSATGCEPCPEGTFSPDGKRCRSCAPGTVWNGTAASSCAACKPGQRALPHSSSTTDSRCEQCPPGTTTFAFGALICRQKGNPCPRGYLQLPSGDCIRCPVDHFFDPTSEQCVRCDEAEGSAGGLPLSCAPCMQIVKARIKDSSCFKDTPGIVVVSEDENVCPSGTRFDAQLGVCIACGRGTFSAANNANECTPCADGSVQPDLMASSCIRCANGTVPDEERVKCVLPQTNCAIGADLVSTPQAPEGSDTRPGLFCQSLGCDTPPENVESAASRTCGPCNRNESMNAEMACSLCPSNSISDGKFCVACPAGLVRDVDTCACRGVFAQNRGLVNGVCEVCPPGSYGHSMNVLEENHCEQCPAGTYRDLASDSDLAACQSLSNENCPHPAPCKRCPPNTITREPGATQCEPCPQGTFSYGLGESECLREGASSEPVLFSDPFGITSDFSLDFGEPTTEPLPVLDELDGTLTNSQPEESLVPQPELHTTDSFIASSPESVLGTDEELSESPLPSE